MNAIKCILLVSCVLSLGLSVRAEEVEDPIQDFFNQYKSAVAIPPNATPGEILIAKQHSGDVLMFRVDLNGDGREEVFLSHENNVNARLGNIWNVYISKGDKYERSDGFPSLDYDALFLKKCAATGRQRLFSVSSAGGKAEKALNLYEIVASKNSVDVQNVARINLLVDREGAIDHNADVVNDLLKDSAHKLIIVKGNPTKLKKTAELPAIHRPDSSKDTKTENPTRGEEIEAKK